MTTHSLLRVMVTILVFTAACKSDFSAGTNGNGGHKDSSAQEGGTDQQFAPAGPDVTPAADRELPDLRQPPEAAPATDGAAGAGADAPFTPDSSGGVQSTGGAAGTGGTAGMGTGGVDGSDALAATGGVAGSDGPTATGAGGITDGPMATGGAGGSASPVATGGTGSGGIGGADATAGTAGSIGRVGATGGTGGGRSTVVRVPAINSFTASPATIGAGQSSTLGWGVIAATTLSIDQGVGSVLGMGSVVVTPSQTTTYTLTLNGSVSAQVTVTVAQAGFTPTGGMTVARTGHTATLLANGKVLIAGGANGGLLASAELYDPTAGKFTATGSMTLARQGHTATLLPNGEVLIIGGGGGASAELYDPLAGKFTATGNLIVPRYRHTATLLQSGMVLIAGGTDGTNALASAELYDPAAGTFTATGNLTVTRSQHAATLLQSGMVLIAGGYVTPPGLLSYGLTSAELYDPKAGVFAATGSMTVGRSYPLATLLTDGRVLMSGGQSNFEGYVASNSLERYDPTARTFAATGSMTEARAYYTSTLLPNGTVLIVGGYRSEYDLRYFFATAELYDPTTGVCSATGSLATGREFHTATLLPNGTVLVAGGDREGSVLASAELYR